MQDVLMWMAGIAVIAVIIWIVHLVDERRAKAMQAACEDVGFEFERYPQGIPGPGLSSIPLFRLGTDRHVRNLWWGTYDDTPVKLFDYEFTTGTGDSVKIEHRTVCAMHLPDGHDMPSFTARPERLRDVVLDALGMQDIDIDESPDFSRRFVLRSKDEAGVRQLFTREICHHLESVRDVCLASGGGWLIAHKLAKKLKPHQVVAFMRESVETYRLFVAAGSRRETPPMPAPPPEPVATPV